jgi:hypothetical protein
MVTVISSPLEALRVRVITKVYCVPLAYPVRPLAPLVASWVQTVLPLEDRKAELVPGAVLSKSWNGELLPIVVAMFINTP